MFQSPPTSHGIVFLVSEGLRYPPVLTAPKAFIGIEENSRVGLNSCKDLAVQPSATCYSNDW